jgi:UDP-N-acetylglucosamine--N-acetylmuramyl-(pentapeptide) pyrophosphoryl-undecaprenol N-acetylglucosamine transferase
MKHSSTPTPFIAIACGGTGGHLFPGLAIAGRLVERQCAVALLVSPKEVDQQAVRSAKGVEVITLPAVALQRANHVAFVRGFCQSWRTARKLFRSRPPQAALAMGGFTCAPPILAARRVGARTFLHESNSIPGRANRWLARSVDHAFVGFASAASQLRTREATVTGSPSKPPPHEVLTGVRGLEGERVTNL